MNRRDWLKRFPALATVAGLAVAERKANLPASELEDHDFPTTPDGAVIVPCTEPLSEREFPGRAVVVVLPDTWQALVFARALRKQQP